MNGRISTAVLLAVLSAAGCASTVPARIPLADKSVAVVPFSFRERRIDESEAGRMLATMLAGAISAGLEGDVTVKPPLPAREFYGGRPVDKVKAEGVTMVLDVDCLILGHIERFTTRDPGMVGTFRGALQFTLFVFDRRGRLLLSQGISATYPYRQMDPEFVPVMNMSEEEVKMRTLQRAADLASRLFYDCPTDRE